MTRRRCLVWLVCLVAATRTLAADDAPIRLHIFTKADPSGFVDDMSKQRAKAVMEVRKRLVKEKGIVLVEAPDHAQVVFEITHAAIVPVSERRTITDAVFGPRPGAGNPNVKVPEIRAMLRAGTYEVEMIGSSQMRWMHCWHALASQLKTWLKDNRATLTTR